ncbi:MAG: class I SAM-dependent methyltransferase [Clostridiales bacterium]|nr:class I SAM-dependent methyltransferase [Clostridiales bacterium]
MQHEPPRLALLLTRLAFIFCGGSVYRAFADRLPLGGGEQVLDFGCGMGTVAYYAAKKLPQGHLSCLDISERWLCACRKTLRNDKNITFLHAEAPALPQAHFDVIYCHFVLHDIPDRELERVMPALVSALRSGGRLIFREPLDEAEKLGLIKGLAAQGGLSLQDSRVTDVPLMGNALESIYFKP